MTQIVCISYIPWRNNPSRSQQLLSHIPDAEVLFFQPSSSYKSGPAVPGRQVLPNITVYTLSASLYLPRPGPAPIRKALDFIQRCMDSHGFEEPLLLGLHPHGQPI